MGDFLHRVTDCVLRSELLPAGLRMRAMRLVGYDITPGSCIWAGAILRSKNIKIGAGVFINVGFFHDGYDALRIGDNVRIGQFVRVLTATHEIGPPQQRGLVEVMGKPVEIGRGSWIGCGVIIMPGVTIAPGCVIAAGAVVTRSTEPDGLYAGNPAMLTRRLSGTVLEAVAPEPVSPPAAKAIA
jgi:maltose O-acetyltransferase